MFEMVNSHSLRESEKFEEYRNRFDEMMFDGIADDWKIVRFARDEI